MLKRKILFIMSIGATAAQTQAQTIKNDIYQLATTVQNEIFGSTASETELQQVRSDLYAIVSKIRGGATNNQGIYCKRINDTQYYAPARIADQQWLGDNGTDLNRCKQQINLSQNGLLCSRIRETEYYAPRLISDLAWRGDNGTEFDTCGRQVMYSRPSIFCQRIRETDYYAIARIATGEWMQANGTSLDECLTALGTVALENLSANRDNVGPNTPNDRNGELSPR